MKKNFAVSLSLATLLCVGIMAQVKEPEVKPIKINEHDALAIRDTQIHYFVVQRQIEQLEKEKQETLVKINQTMLTAYKNAKLKPEDYDLDDQKWEFVAKAKPAAAKGKEDGKAEGKSPNSTDKKD